MDQVDVTQFLLEQIQELREKVEKLEYQKTFEYRDINNKLSNHVQKVIEDTKGPLKPYELQKFLTDDAFNKPNKKILPIIRKYSKNIDGVRLQILRLYDNIETHMIHRKQQKDLDDKLMKKIKKINKSVDEEHVKEKKTNLENQSTLYKYFDKKSDNANEKNIKKSSKPEVIEVYDSSKRGASLKLVERNGRKRKSRINDESSSSQESDIMHLSAKFSKRFRLKSPEYSTESSQSSELRSVASPEGSQSSIEPMSVASPEGSQSSAEPMSVASPEGSQSSAEPMSIANSEETSSHSDAMSVDDSTETVVKTKSTKKLKGKVAKQPESRLGDDAADHKRNEETVPERNLRIRK